MSSAAEMLANIDNFARNMNRPTESMLRENARNNQNAALQTHTPQLKRRETTLATEFETI